MSVIGEPPAAPSARPQAVTADNGGEFVMHAMDAWATRTKSDWVSFGRANKPVENAFIERFNGKLRDESLNSRVFSSVLEAQLVLGVEFKHVGHHAALVSRDQGA